MLLLLRGKQDEAGGTRNRKSGASATVTSADLQPTKIQGARLKTDGSRPSLSDPCLPGNSVE